jgi:ubiquitin-activating enzyme E1
LVGNYNVVVLIDQPLTKSSLIADYCHTKGIAVLVADTKGVFGSIFCDFGENFIVHDKDGEQFASSMIAGISRDSRALVTVLEETRHNLETGDKVILSEISGMEELNGREFTVTVKDLFSFEIDVDTSHYKNGYERGGYVNQIKQPVTMSFSTFSKSIETPGEFICDFNKMDRAPVLHLAFR